MPKADEVPKQTEMLVFGVESQEEIDRLVLSKGWTGERQAMNLMDHDDDRGTVTITSDWTIAQLAAHAKIGFNFAANVFGPAFVLKSQFDFVRAFITEERPTYLNEWLKPVQQPITTVDGEYPVGHLLHLRVQPKPVRIIATVVLYNALGFSVVLAQEPWEGVVPPQFKKALFFNIVDTQASVGEVRDLNRTKQPPAEGQIAFKLDLPRIG